MRREVAWTRPVRTSGRQALFDGARALRQLGDRDPWLEHMPDPQPLPPALIEEGHAIPVARVQAMHEGKRRERAARGTDAT